MPIDFILCSREDCDGLVFKDITNSTDTPYDENADVSAYTGWLEVFALPRVTGDTPVAIYTVQPSIDLSAEYDLIYSDSDVDNLVDGFYEVTYTVKEGNVIIGTVTKKFQYTCHAECTLAGLALKIANGGCSASLLEVAEAFGQFDAMIVTYNQEEYAVAAKALSGLQKMLHNCNC